MVDRVEGSAFILHVQNGCSVCLWGTSIPVTVADTRQYSLLVPESIVSIEGRHAQWCSVFHLKQRALGLSSFHSVFATLLHKNTLETHYKRVYILASHRQLR